MRRVGVVVFSPLSVSLHAHAASPLSSKVERKATKRLVKSTSVHSPAREINALLHPKLTQVPIIRAFIVMGDSVAVF